MKNYKEDVNNLAANDTSLDLLGSDIDTTLEYERSNTIIALEINETIDSIRYFFPSMDQHEWYPVANSDNDKTSFDQYGVIAASNVLEHVTTNPVTIEVHIELDPEAIITGLLEYDETAERALQYMANKWDNPEGLTFEDVQQAKKQVQLLNTTFKEAAKAAEIADINQHEEYKRIQNTLAFWSENLRAYQALLSEDVAQQHTVITNELAEEPVEVVEVSSVNNELRKMRSGKNEAFKGFQAMIKSWKTEGFVPTDVQVKTANATIAVYEAEFEKMQNTVATEYDNRISTMLNKWKVLINKRAPQLVPQPKQSALTEEANANLVEFDALIAEVAELSDTVRPDTPVDLANSEDVYTYDSASESKKALGKFELENNVDDSSELVLSTKDAEQIVAETTANTVNVQKGFKTELQTTIASQAASKQEQLVEARQVIQNTEEKYGEYLTMAMQYDAMNDEQKHPPKLPLLTRLFRNSVNRQIDKNRKEILKRKQFCYETMQKDNILKSYKDALALVRAHEAK